MCLEDAPQYLTFEQLRAEIQRYTYRPGWQMTVFMDPFEGPCFYLLAEVQDAYNPARMVPLGIRSNIPPMRTVEAFGEWLQWRLIQVESHEAREYFRLTATGRPVYDPHDPVVPAPANVAVVELAAGDPLAQRMEREGRQSGVDTFGCDCGHSGMGRGWHLSNCAWIVGARG